MLNIHPKILVEFQHLNCNSLEVEFWPRSFSYENIMKLELCAFTHKGEHNVYSLVPNIPVCIIYIGQKWVYIKL